MILISHRGNINGANPDSENCPDYVFEAIRLGYDVEVDVWKVGDKWFLGHDAPEYEVDINSLPIDKIWFHAKDMESFISLFYSGAHVFYQTTEVVVVTNKGHLWYHTGHVSMYGICVLPEKNGFLVFDTSSGICSDYIERFKK